MARFFLHVRDRSGIICDEDGPELATFEAAVGEARRGIRSLLSESVRAGILDLDESVQIAGPAGSPILLIAFCDAINIRLPGRCSSLDATAERPG